jgi:two-component system, cell cycle sensor histidine kinase and response regulator CckA
LLVEDNPAMRTTTVDLLTALGHQVREAQDGHQALQWLLAEQAPIDLLITDVVMPDMTGKELVDRLQAQRPEIPCLFISGYTDQISLRHDQNSNRVSRNRVDFLAKPFAAADLAQKIDELLPQPPAALGLPG